MSSTHSSFISNEKQHIKSNTLKEHSVSHLYYDDHELIETNHHSLSTDESKDSTAYHSDMGLKDTITNSDVYYESKSKKTVTKPNQLRKGLNSSEKQDGSTDILTTICQKELTGLQSWALFWGATCRRTATKENQDGWFVLRSVLPIDNTSHSSCFMSQSPMSQCPISQGPNVGSNDNNEGEVFSTPCPQDIDYLSYKNDRWGCWIPSSQISTSCVHSINPNQIPSPNTLNDLNNRIMAINLDSAASPTLPNPKITSSPDDSRGGVPMPDGLTLHPDTLWSLTCRRPWVIGVLDGHGSGGRLASHEASKTLTNCIQSRLRKEDERAVDVQISSRNVCRCPKIELKTRLCELRDILFDAFELTQDKLLASNAAASRDFGTTAVVTVCAGRYLITATCGDSSAILVVSAQANAKSSAVVVNVQLSVDHTLLSPTERERISSEGKGRIVVGDGGVHRLIPGFFSYEQAKMKGLSINMARALGHFLLSKCSLSPIPQLTLVDLSDIYQTLQDLHRNDLHQNNDHSKPQSYLFEARAFDATLEHKFKGTTQAYPSPETTETEVPTSTDSGPLKSGDIMQLHDIESDGDDEQEIEERNEDCQRDSVRTFFHSMSDASNVSNEECAATGVPTVVQSGVPTVALSDVTTDVPTVAPCGVPTVVPSCVPTDVPFGIPTDVPSGVPTDVPSGVPTDIPSGVPTDVPSGVPTDILTHISSDVPTVVPSGVPTDVPTHFSSDIPNNVPTGVPTDYQQQTDDLLDPKSTIISDSSSDNDVLVILDDGSPISESPRLQGTSTFHSGSSFKRKTLSEEIISQRSDFSLRSVSSTSNRKHYRTSSNGMKRRSSWIEGQNRHESTLESLHDRRTCISWGVRDEEAALDWLSPDDNDPVRLSSDAENQMDKSHMKNDANDKLTGEEEKISYANGGSKDNGFWDISSDVTWDTKTDLVSLERAENVPITSVEGLSPTGTVKVMSGSQETVELTDALQTETTSSTRCETDQTEDEWTLRNQDPDLLASMSQLIRNTTSLLILMSDGVSDVLSRSQVGELALSLDKSGNTPEQVSEFITYKAAQMRHQRGFRADNCTCVVVKLLPCLDR